MEIKICGLRRAEDIDIVNKYKPDYIGFVFAKSRRQVTAEKAAELSAGLDGKIKTVGVFVNEAVPELVRIYNTAGLDVIQLHGDEDEAYAEKLREAIPDAVIWKAVRIDGRKCVGALKNADRLLLDKYSTDEYGGTGETFDWSAVPELDTSVPIMLAGGLNADNVLKGISIFRPAGVDVSSGVETDGFKDEAKIKKFIETVRGQTIE